MAKFFKKNYVLADPTSSSAWQLLCSWDFSIVNEKAVRQRKNNLRVQLKVNMSVLRGREWRYHVSKTLSLKPRMQIIFSQLAASCQGLIPI